MHCLRAATLVLALILNVGAVSAQFVPSGSEAEAPVVSDPSPNDVKEFLRLLGDPTIQAWITDSANSDGTLDGRSALTLREQVDAQLARIGERARSLALAWQVLPQVPTVLSDIWVTELSHAQKVRSLTYVLVFLLIGFGLEWLYRQILHYPLLRIEQAPKDAPSQKVVGALLRAAIIFAGLGIFAIEIGRAHV